MKKASLLICLGMLAGSSMAAAVPSVKSGTYYGAAVSSFSDNGNWMACEADQRGSILIFDLANDLQWQCIASGEDDGLDYTLPFTRAVSDDGTMVGEVWNIPAYWRNGEWTQLKGWLRDDSGYVYAVVGAITPDGSMIVGGMGKGGGSLMDEEENPMEEYQMTYPCVWYRQEDGTYGEPVWLPNTGKDFFGRNPQYVHCIAVSADGKTIGAMMRSGNGFFHFPLAYTLNDNGEWDLHILGMNLVNPKNYTPAPWPGDYYGAAQPNYELYMSQEELARFSASAGPIAMKMQAEGYTEEEITIWEVQYAAEFMSAENKAKYEPIVKAFVDEWTTWDTQWKKYEASLEQIMNSGYDFEFNNILISPDGKYIYSSAKSGMSTDYTRVRIDWATDEYLLYPNTQNILVSGITEDYSILGHAYDTDTDLYRIAYIFPKGEPTAMPLYEYFQDDKPIYDWMEENLYRSVVVSVTASGGEIYDDRWTMGKPVCTPDMSLLGFAGTTLYWETSPVSSNTVTFLLNVSQMSGVDEVAVETDAYIISPRRGGIIEVKGNVSSLEVIDLSGYTMYRTSNPKGMVDTGLKGGVYVVRAVTASGEVIAKKALF